MPTERERERERERDFLSLSCKPAAPPSHEQLEYENTFYSYFYRAALQLMPPCHTNTSKGKRFEHVCLCFLISSLYPSFIDLKKEKLRLSNFPS
jgi:hypothetical protein